MKPIRWINAGQVSGLRSQSIYHALAEAQTPETPDTIVVSIPKDPYMCIGYFQDANKELDVGFCKENNLQIIRRQTGGGAVYIDSSQIFVQWIFQEGNLPAKLDQRFLLFNKPLIETYTFFGINAYHYPVNDVHVSGKKIVGTGAATIGNATVVTGNFIFDFNKDAMAKALNVPDQHFRDQMLEGLTDYMTNFKKELESPPSMQEVVDKYLESCETLFDAPIERGEFSQIEYEEMDRVDQKFNSEKWLYQFSSTPEKIKLVKVHSAVWIAQCICDTPFNGYSLFIRINERKLENVRFINKKNEKSNENFSKLENALAGEDIENKNLFKVINTFFAQNMPKFDDNDTKVLVGHIIDMWTERVKKGGYAG